MKHLTVLNFSGGTQSACLLWMIIDGHISKPDNFLVVFANPGMEKQETIDYVLMMFTRCQQADIDIRLARGPNLLTDVLSGSQKRLDNPPLWIKKANGKRGQLRQCCTKQYKVLPMQRCVREYMDEKWGISANPRATRHLARAVSVTTWVGFSADETHRVDKLLAQKHPVYKRFEFPLQTLGMQTHDVVRYMREHGHDLPPRSLCNGCFAHGLRSLKEIHDNRPADWQQAVAFDHAIRDMSRFGVTQGECFVSDTLLPLEELADRGFDLGSTLENVRHECDTGMCFV